MRTKKPSLRSTAAALSILLLATFGATAETRTFKLLDATQYVDKPNLSQYGFEKLNVIYAHFMWPNQKVTDAVPPQKFLETQFQHFGTFDGSPWCIDIEHWTMDGNDAEAGQRADKLLSVLAAARRVNPAVKIGFYGEIPLNAYYPAIAAIDSEKHREWVSKNLRNRNVADAVDFIFPSTYTFYHQPGEWALYAERQIRMAKAYGKPVYAFIWPQYHESNALRAYDFIERDFWRLQLETIYKHADGVVIWGGWDFARGRRAQWDENAPWWQETKAFLAALKAPPVAPANPSAVPR